MLKEISHLHRELEACTRELSAALQQQAATADILKIISGSNIDLAQVLNALVATAARLCGATFGGIFLREGGRLRGGATIGLEAKDVAEFMDVMLPIDHTTVSGRVVMLGRVVNIPDIEADPNYDLAAIRPITIPLTKRWYYLSRFPPGRDQMP